MQRSRGMKLEKIEDFEVWKKAEAFWDAVNAILQRSCFGRNVNLRNQVEDAIDSILSNMSEGFEQPTDRGFAKYLYTSKASTAETCTRLDRSCKRQMLTPSELRAIKTQGEEVIRMTTGLIEHLMRTPDRRRGVQNQQTSDRRRRRRLPTND
jgi:four helix bundle protein